MISRHRLAGSLMCAALLGAAAATPARAESPFAALAGSWSGGGTIHMSNGGEERLRCRVTYALGDGGNSVQQNIRCASDSYRVEIVSNAAARGSTLYGNWTETSRGVSGQLSGQIAPGRVDASIAGAGFAAAIGISTRGATQSISIRVQGGDVQSVLISLKKG